MIHIFKKKIEFDSKAIIKQIKSKNMLKRYTLLFVGTLISALAFNLFFYPNNLVIGGISGISIIVNNFFHLDPAVFMFFGSSLLLIVSYFLLGRETTAGSVVGSLVYPIFVELTTPITSYIQLDNSDLLMMAVFGGIFAGFGYGLIYKAGFTTGGTDIVNQIVSKYFKISMGNSMIVSDGLIVLAGGFFFGETKVMYAAVVLYIISVLTDKVLLGISQSKAFYIITSKEEAIQEYFLENLNHGVTVLSAKGGFTNHNQKVIMCVIPTKEYFIVKEGIHEIDPEAFFVVTDAYEVSGGA